MDIAALKASAERATPGPWDVASDPCHYDSRTDICAAKAVIAQTCGEWEPMEPNATYIALANPTAILSLIERVAALEEALTKIIDMNVQYAKDKYGDASIADGMSCVVVARAALSPTNTQADE